ncbi:MAG: hypothetical protein KBT20_08325 [Bacteroidales bacterium]|nr:hypothetical protein [Candidatus Liminaster caballi]
MKRLTFVAALFALALGAFAQSTQPVQILEYNGKDSKTPLKGVGLTVNNAGAAMSDDQGLLTLSFRTLKAGDAVVLRRLEKAGYEVFNQEAVEQWTVAPQQTFQLILCRSDRFRALCDQYNQVASESYARQLEKDKARIRAEREAGKLKEAEYQSKLQAVQDQYDEQLENLDLYVEKFARFDLSELSEAEQNIIALVQEGKIDDAILRYEQMNLLGQYQTQSREIKQINSAQDSLSVIRQNKVEARDSIRQIIDFMEGIRQ